MKIKEINLPKIFTLLTGFFVVVVVIFLSYSFISILIPWFLEFGHFSTSLELGVQKTIQTLAYSLAMLELMMTATGYFKDGRFHVTNIVDTVLIIFLYELIKVWFLNEFHFENVSLLLLVLAVISGMRILAIKFHPDYGKLENSEKK